MSIDDATPQEWDAAYRAARTKLPERVIPPVQKWGIFSNMYKVRGAEETIAELNVVRTRVLSGDNRMELDWVTSDVEAAFHWECTPQGHVYWMDVSGDVYDLIGECAEDFKEIYEQPEPPKGPAAILYEAADLMQRKAEDYQGDAYQLEDYFPFGDKSYLHMIHTKYTRLMSVCTREGDTNFESAEDTLLDMINYCSFYVKYLREQNEK